MGVCGVELPWETTERGIFTDLQFPAGRGSLLRHPTSALRSEAVKGVSALSASWLAQASPMSPEMSAVTV